MNYLGSKDLETEKLYLHKTYEKDLKELWNILCLESVSKYYLTTRINLDWDKEKEYQYKKLDKASDFHTFTWTIEVKETNEVIGQISIVDTDKEDIKDIGWFIDPSHQNKGYAYNAAEAVLKYMFLEVGIKKIETSAAIENTKSWHLMEKLGFKRCKDYKYTKYTFIDNEVKCYKYEIDKNTFLKELFRKESLRIEIDIDKDPYIKHISDDHILNITGESGSGKSFATTPYKNDPMCIVIDTDLIFNKKDNELYKLFINKYNRIPSLYEEFDIIYKDIIDYYKDSDKTIIIDSAQFRNLKDLSLLKGDIIVIRTCINTCYDRCVNRYKEKNTNATFDDIINYSVRKKDIYKWYEYLNKFLYKLDKE